MFERTILKDHFESDDFFSNSSTLFIIDNYNVFGIDNDAINFYVNNFRDSGCRKIEIYFQVNFEKDKNHEDLINNLADKCDFDYNTFHSIYSLLRIKFHYSKQNDPNKEKLFMNSFKKSIYKVVRAKSFVRRMKEIGIEVVLIPFSEAKINPPFHGRYWLIRPDNKNGKGYIVDASLNTYGKGKVFAQLMDNENFERISELFDDLIVKSTFGVKICLEELEYIIDKLNKIFPKNY